MVGIRFFSFSYRDSGRASPTSRPLSRARVSEIRHTAAPSRYSSWLMLRPWVIWVLPEANSSMPSTESTASTGTLWLLVWMDSMAMRQLEVLSMTSWAVTPSGSSWMLGRLYWV